MIMKHPGRLAAMTILSALAMVLLSACEPPLSPVGFRIFEWTYAGDYGAPKPLVTAVWYPTTPDADANAMRRPYPNIRSCGQCYPPDLRWRNSWPGSASLRPTASSG